MSRVRVLVAFTEEIAERMDNVFEHFEFRTRAHFIDTAVRRYLEECEEEIDQEEEED